VRADRELPVVWAVAKGSARNKLIIVPVAIAISALAPWAIMPLLMIGGAYLCCRTSSTSWKLEARILRWPAMAGMLRLLVATLAETAVGVLLGAISLAATRLVASAFKARI